MKKNYNFIFLFLIFLSILFLTGADCNSEPSNKIGLTTATTINLPTTTTIGKVFYTTDGGVNSICYNEKKHILYIGGNFTKVGMPTGYGVIINSENGEPLVDLKNMPRVNKAINTVISDGNGGWYIGGSFTKVGNTIRTYIARINSDGTLNDFNIECEGTYINTLLLSGTTLYVGGNFSKIGGQTRQNFAAIDTSTGNVTSLDVYPNGPVNTLALSGNTLYVGGQFATIKGQSRKNLAAI
ncbi:MAG TPA: delta-60 repeat domain-containing protein, partial [Spirochaetota bacterium]|nr:delta-60 repeat domain-containing protein [Spirochaetota bacterium]